MGWDCDYFRLFRRANLTYCDIGAKGCDGRNVSRRGSFLWFAMRFPPQNHRAVSTRTIDEYKKHMVPFTRFMKVWALSRRSTTYVGSWWLWARVVEQFKLLNRSRSKIRKRPEERRDMRLSLKFSSGSVRSHPIWLVGVRLEPNPKSSTCPHRMSFRQSHKRLPRSSARQCKPGPDRSRTTSRSRSQNLHERLEYVFFGLFTYDFID